MSLGHLEVPFPPKKQERERVQNKKNHNVKWYVKGTKEPTKRVSNDQSHNNSSYKTKTLVLDYNSKNKLNICVSFDINKWLNQ